MLVCTASSDDMTGATQRMVTLAPAAAVRLMVSVLARAMFTVSAHSGRYGIARRVPFGSVFEVVDAASEDVVGGGSTIAFTSVSQPWTC